jgi:hypothetical protein
MIVFVAGSDLNREIGPVAGQIARQVLRSRLARLQRRVAGVDLIPWVGIGSGPMRSGLGHEPEQASALHPGMTFTVQPDQLDQPNAARVIEGMWRAATSARPELLSPGDERSLIAVAALFADEHARTSLRSGLATIRLANLLGPLNQRGRKNSTAKLLYERDGVLMLRSARPAEATDGTVYGRSLDVAGMTRLVPKEREAQRRALQKRQRTIEKIWPRGLADPRAIAGAFARYVGGEALTTVAGLGRALSRARAVFGRSAVERLRPFVTFLVRNDGFTLTRDRELVRRRISVLSPELAPPQVERRLRRYFDDIAALEAFLGVRLEQLISKADRARYERAARRLLANPRFVDYMKGQDVPIGDWLEIIDHVIPLLSNPSWNRIGRGPVEGPADRRLA